MKTKRMIGIVAGTALALTAVFSAAVTLGISSALATNIYFVLQGVSWVGLAVSIIAGMGLGATIGTAIYAAVKRMALKQFVQW